MLLNATTYFFGNCFRFSSWNLGFSQFHFFFYEVSNLCNRILTNQKCEFVVSKCQWKCMLFQISLWPQVKRSVIISNKQCIYELTHELQQVEQVEIHPRTTVAPNICKWPPSALNPQNTIMPAGDTNSFPEHKDIGASSSTANKELQHINEWSFSNKLSLNVEKTTFSIFHNKKRIIYKIPWHLIRWKPVMEGTFENDIAKYIRLIYKPKLYLNKDSLLALYFSYTHY